VVHLKHFRPSLVLSSPNPTRPKQLSRPQRSSQSARAARSKASRSSSLQRVNSQVEDPTKQSSNQTDRQTDRQTESGVSRQPRSGKRTTLTSTNDATSSQSVSRRETDRSAQTAHTTLSHYCLTQLCFLSSPLFFFVQCAHDRERRDRHRRKRSRGSLRNRMLSQLGPDYLQAERSLESGRNSAFRCVSGPWPSQSVPPMSGGRLFLLVFLRGRLVEGHGKEIGNHFRRNNVVEMV
jgi:hypothetical protein